MPQQQQSQQPPPPDASWNTSNHASNFFKPADLNQNFTLTPNQPLATMAQPQQQPQLTQQNDGWGDWGDEWAGESAPATAVANVNNNNPMAVENNFNQQLPPPVLTNQHQPTFNDNAFYANQNQQPPQSLYTAPANYPPPPSVANYDQNAEQDHPQPPPQFNSNVIADSFASSDNWNWNSGAAGPVDSNANNVELIRKPAVFNKMSTNAIEKLSTTESYSTNQPDDMKSQNYGQQATTVVTPVAMEERQAQMNQQSDDLDPLDVALMQMNVQQQQHQQQQFTAVPDAANFFRSPQTFPGGISLPNQSARVENQEVMDQISEAVTVESTPMVSSSAPPLPVPIVETAPVEVMPPPPAASLPPPAMSTMPPPPAQSNVAGNPFKRSGAAVHRNLQFHSAPGTSTNVISPIPATTPPLPQTNAISSSIPHNNNDRNAYLQTDQLSEDVVHKVTNTRDVPPTESFDTLPPPGLSRLVLGETEDHHTANIVVSQPSMAIPPPGLNRMVPGTDLENAPSDMALQREADGQDDDDDMALAMNYPLVPSDLTDRNLYRVPGESHQDQQPPPSRVVTGDENTVPFSVQSTSVDLPGNSGQMILPTHPPVEEIRDLQPVEGENSCDDDNVRFNRQHGEMLDREEPIEGENAGDADVVISSGGAAAAAVASAVNETHPEVGGVSMAIEGGSLPSSNVNTRKETSTGEESDRERASYYKSKSGRDRDVDTGSLRRKAKPKERYDSESDNSDQRRDQRRPFDRSYVSEKSRGEDRRHRRGPDESSRGHNRTTERGERRHGDADYERNYGRGGEERRSKRYYDDERDEAMPRRRATDENAKRAEKERQYRKDRDRDREDRRGEYRDRDEKEQRHRGGGGGGGYSNREKDPRRYDYDDERYNRSGSRNTDRSRDPRYSSSGGGYYGPSKNEL